MTVKDLIKALNKDHVDQESDLIYCIQTQDMRFFNKGHWDISFSAKKEDDEIVFTGGVIISCKLDDEDIEDLSEEPMREEDWA
jgi:hypothetical protein